MTDDEAKAMLKQLRAHFGGPVMPIREYCKGLEDWRNALHQRASHLKDKLYPGMADPDRNADPEKKRLAETSWERYSADKKLGDRYGLCRGENRQMQEFDHRVEKLRRYESDAEAADRVFLMIHKSSLLDRILYAGEKVRTRMCPEHEGRWCGLESSHNICPHGCQLTGWIPEPEDAERP